VAQGLLGPLASLKAPNAEAKLLLAELPAP
jgi:hypothetical protein